MEKNAQAEVNKRVTAYKWKWRSHRESFPFINQCLHLALFFYTSPYQVNPARSKQLCAESAEVQKEECGMAQSGTAGAAREKKVGKSNRDELWGYEQLAV